VDDSMKKFIRQVRKIKLDRIVWVLFAIIVVIAFTPIFVLLWTIQVILLMCIIAQKVGEIIWLMLTDFEDVP
jgi:hypothetical protein